MDLLTLRGDALRYPIVMPSRRITLVAFDLDNTLVDRDEAFHTGLKQWMQKTTGLDEHGEDLPQQITRLDANGYTPRTEFCTGLAGLLGTTRSKADQIWDGIRQSMLASIRPDRRVHEILTTLTTHTHLALISNGSADTQRSKLRSAELEQYFSQILISEEVGMAKPDSAIFQRLFSDGRHKPEGSLFVGDHPAHDIAGARNLSLIHI